MLFRYLITATFYLFSAALANAQGEASTQQHYHNVIGSLDGTISEDSPHYISYHTAFIALSEFDSKESVPHLIECLAQFPSNKRNRVQCTWIHLRETLMAQTGEDFGFSHDDWQLWWEENGKELPRAHFNTVENKQKIREKYRAGLSEEKAELIATLKDQIDTLAINQEASDALNRILQNFDGASVDRSANRDLIRFIVGNDIPAWKDQPRFERIMAKNWFNRKPAVWLTLFSGPERIDVLFAKSDNSLLSINMHAKRESHIKTHTSSTLITP